MKRSTFLSAGVLGFTALNLPNFVPAQNNAYSGTLEPFSIPPRQPLAPGPGNTDVRTIIHSQQTGGQLSNIEVAVGSKQMGPSPHLHDSLDELMFVLEGTATVMIGEKIYEIEAGGWNFRPPANRTCFLECFG
jgi:mannose-6-phosphate isomerase-like protein (cupin superfamily)